MDFDEQRAEGYGRRHSVRFAEVVLQATARLDLVERWGGWERQPFGASSSRHVSVYGRPSP